MQILHPFTGSIQQYREQLSDPGRYRPDHCPQCQAKPPLTAHGFYHRSLTDPEFEGDLPVRRYLCRSCKRTVSLLPQFALPFLRFSIPVIALFLIARLLHGCTLKVSAQAAAQPAMPYQRGQFWCRRFQKQAEALCAALAALTAPQAAPHFVTRALDMLQTIGWIPAHRFLFSGLRTHLLGWPPTLAPHGRPATLRPAWLSTGALPHNTCIAFSRRPRVSFSSGRFLMDAKAEKLALFRYGLIAPLVLETLPRGQLTRRAEEIAARQYDIPDSQRISVSVDTLLEWSLRYRRGGFDALAHFDFPREQLDPTVCQDTQESIEIVG